MEICMNRCFLFLLITLGSLTWPSAAASEINTRERLNSPPQAVVSRDLYPGENARQVRAVHIEIRRILSRAGLARQTIDGLQRNGFPYGAVRRAVRRAAMDQGQGQANALRRANEVAQRVTRLGQSAPGSADLLSPRGDPLAEGRGGSWRDQQIREKLEQAGLSGTVIRALQRDGFPPEAIEEQIREWLLDTGYEEHSAEMVSRNLTNQIRAIRQGGRHPRESTRLAKDEEQERSPSAGAIRELLERVGMSSRQIRRLEQRDFPHDQVRIMVEEALEGRGYAPSRAHRRATEIAAQVQRWRGIRSEP
jgi:hypothetical protein